jgi:uncharacterized membrane protein
MKSRIINALLFVAALVSTLIVLETFPNTIPTHFDQYGVADGWGSKYTLLLLPGTILIIQIIGELCMHYFSKRKKEAIDEKIAAEAGANLKVLKITFIITSALFFALNCVVLYMTYCQIDNNGLQKQVDISKILVILMGATFIIMGNFMPKTRMNGLIGFRCDWTMFNEYTWKKSNFFAAIGMIILGILTALSGFIFDGFVGMIVMLCLLMVYVIISLIYAYFVYKNERERVDRE